MLKFSTICNKCTDKNIKSGSLVLDILGVVFFILGIYLITKEFHLFTVEKPTHATTQSQKMQSSYIPIIKLCPQPGMDISRITGAGYSSLYAYFAGYEDEDENKFLGWSGNFSSHPFEFLETLCVLKNVSDLIISAKYFGYQQAISALLELNRQVNCLLADLGKNHDQLKKLSDCFAGRPKIKFFPLTEILPKLC